MRISYNIRVFYIHWWTPQVGKYKKCLNKDNHDHKLRSNNNPTAFFLKNDEISNFLIIINIVILLFMFNSSRAAALRKKCCCLVLADGQIARQPTSSLRKLCIYLSNSKDTQRSSLVYIRVKTTWTFVAFQSVLFIYFVYVEVNVRMAFRMNSLLLGSYTRLSCIIIK